MSLGMYTASPARRFLHCLGDFFQVGLGVQHPGISAERKADVDDLLEIFPGAALGEVRTDMRLELRFRFEVYEDRHREKFPSVQVEAFARIVIAEAVRGEKVVG